MRSVEQAPFGVFEQLNSKPPRVVLFHVREDKAEGGNERIHRVLRRVSILAGAAGLAAVLLWRRTNRPAQTSWSPSTGRMVDEFLPARVVGEGSVSVALLHGLFNSGRYWGAAYDAIADPGALIVPDLLGFGRAPKPPSGYTADSHADAVARTLRGCGVHGRVLLGAHSIGALVAMRLAIRHPDLVGGIVAFAPPLYATPEAARRQISSIDPLARVLLSNEALGERLCGAMCRYPAVAAAMIRFVHPTLPAPLADDRVRHSWSSYRETLSGLVLAAEAPAWIADIDVPIRIVAGARDGAVDLAFLHAVAGLHQHVSLRVVPDAGHDLPLTHPEECVHELRDALARL